MPDTTQSATSPDLKGLHYLVVGAGIFGCTIAEHIARLKQEPVLVIDKRPHIGGNCHSAPDAQTGIEVHTYGTHIFHTAIETVWDYVNRFTGFNAYRHQVLTTHADRVFQMPINLETINSFYGLNLKPFEVEDFLKQEIQKDAIGDPQNFEEVAISMVGRPLYEAFIRGYTMKQWGCDPKHLPGFIIKRLPFRTNYDENYYFDPWQGIPLTGYTGMLERMLDHALIDVRLNTDYFDMRDAVSADCLTVYTGAIDRLLDFRFGRLEYRTLEFEREVVDVPDYQGTSVMNYADPDIPYTRVHEPRHLHPERDYDVPRSVIVREYPHADAGESPYYPVNKPHNNALVDRYAELAAGIPNMILGGRLADYKYYDMDRAIEKALAVYHTRVAAWSPA